tara:strand:- start:304 stop:840 length:537 start_codon:yes stop_codon:yes gene_type:complete
MAKRLGTGLLRAQMQDIGAKTITMTNSKLTGVVGVELLQYSEETTVDTAQANYDVALTIPANAMITDIGYVCTTQIDVAGSGTLTFSAGLASSYTDVLTGTQINQTAADIIAGVVQSSALANLPHASGARIPVITPAVVLHSTSERTLNIRMTVGGATLSAAGAYRGFVKYILIEDIA